MLLPQETQSTFLLNSFTHPTYTPILSALAAGVIQHPSSSASGLLHSLSNRFLELLEGKAAFHFFREMRAKTFSKAQILFFIRDVGTRASGEEGTGVVKAQNWVIGTEVF